MHSKENAKYNLKPASNQQQNLLNYQPSRKTSNYPSSQTPMKYVSALLNQENVDPNPLSQINLKKQAFLNANANSDSQYQHLSQGLNSHSNAITQRGIGNQALNKRGDSGPASMISNSYGDKHGPLSEITQIMKNSQNQQLIFGRAMKSSSQNQQLSSGSGVIVGSVSQPLLAQKNQTNNRVSGVFKIKQNPSNSQQSKKNPTPSMKYAKNVNVNNITNYNLQNVSNTNNNITVNLLSNSQTSRIHEYFQQAEVRRKNNPHYISKKDQHLQPNVPTPSNRKQTSGGSTLEFDDDVDNMNCLASQVSNVVSGFEQRRFSEKNFKVFTNHINKEGRNVSQIILELDESNQMKSTNDIHNSSGKIHVLSSKIKKNASTKAKDNQNALQNYLSNNSSNKSSTKNEYSISNYKTPNQSHVLNSKETPQIQKAKHSEIKCGSGIPQQAQPSVDTKTLLSDHIKKHIRAVRNTINNNPSMTSPKIDKMVSKSCNKVASVGEASQIALSTQRRETLGSPAQENFYGQKSKRPFSNLEGQFINSQAQIANDKENASPLKANIQQISRKNIKINTSPSPDQSVYGQQYRHIMHQNYVNPQNTIVQSNMNSNKYSKITNNTTSAYVADIGEETQRNQVNETRTIKDKLGNQQILTPPLSQNQGFKSRHESTKDTESSRFSNSSPKRSVSPNSYDMQPILDQERLFFELTKTIMNDKDTSQIDFSAMQGTTKQAFEFMRRILSKHGSQIGQSEEKLINMYFQTCKIELVVQQLIKKIQNDIYPKSPSKIDRGQNQSSSIVHNYMKNVIIHTHQNILYFLEIATLLMGGNQIQNLTSKLSGMRQNIDTSLQSLQNICRIKRQDEAYFEDLLVVLKKVEVMKLTNQSLQSFEGSLSSLDAQRAIQQTPAGDKKNMSKLKGNNDPNYASPQQNQNYQNQNISPNTQTQQSQLKPYIRQSPNKEMLSQANNLNSGVNHRHASTSPVNTRKSFILPEVDSSKYQYTLVLDLDETLVHFEAAERKFKIRPNCITFLKTLSQLFEIVIFTAASQDYADWILDVLDPTKTYIQHRLYRQHTQYDDGVYVKDLNLLGRDLKKTIIIDNIRENFERQDANGIEIVTWLNDPNDRELDNLMIFLKGLVEAQVKDVRPMINLFKAECWKSPTKTRGNKDVYAGDKVSPKGCTPHTDKKGNGLLGIIGNQTDAKFIR